MSDLWFQAQSAARSLSPASRRWRRFLRSLPLDPDSLLHPITEPTERDFILCGAPRTGTTVLCAMLFQPPAIVTVMEPWDGMRLPPARLFSSLRDSIDWQSQLPAGKLDTRALQASGEVKWAGEGQSGAPLAVDEGFALGVKWPVFWRYLPYLPTTKFVVTLRHPFEVISSFRRQGGRLRLGLDYDTAFNWRMNNELLRATRDPAVRRVRFFDYVHERILPFLSRTNVHAVRYERWFTEPLIVHEELGEFLGIKLTAGPARLRPPAALDLSARERALISSECRTATALGYELWE